MLYAGITIAYGLPLQNAEAGNTMRPKQCLALKARLDKSDYRTGDSIKPVVTIVNTSSRRVSFTCLQPLLIEPLILQNGKRQALTVSPDSLKRKPEKLSIDAGCALACEAMTVVLHEGVLDYKTPANKPTAFWQPAPGIYTIRFAVELTGNHVSGTLVSEDTSISVTRRDAGREHGSNRNHAECEAESSSESN